MSLPSELAERCRVKKAEQQSKIPSEWLIEAPPDTTVNVLDLPTTYGILTDFEIEITELDDVALLLEKLAKGVWSAVDVTRAYCKRAIIAHQLTNCLTEFWIDDALTRAAELDAAREAHGPVGPLHGLPISLKDQFDVAGRENNMGLASWLGRISQDDAALVKIFRKSGAVIYTRTNVPMALMMPETVNHVYGRTVNPINRNLTCGGSSGGEGTLLAMKGSPVGVGTDLGGSIRIPSNLNRLYGLRPTMRRVPYYGASNTLLGQESIESSIGPLGRTLSGCVSLFKAIVDGQPWDFDTKVVEIKWRKEMLQLTEKGGPDAKMCFGFYDDDGYVKCLPPIQRAIKETVDALRAAGHTVIPWKPLDHQKAISILQRTFASDCGEEFERLFGESKEPLLPGIDDVSAFGPITVNAYWQLCLERDAYRQQYLNALLATASETPTGRPIDAIICPVAPFPPPPHNKYVYAGYTCVWNVLDMPSVALPVTSVNVSTDVPEKAYTPRNEVDAEVYSMYEQPEKFQGCPVGVQVVGRRWREEEVLGLAKIVDDVLRAKRGQS